MIHARTCKVIVWLSFLVSCTTNEPLGRSNTSLQAEGRKIGNNFFSSLKFDKLIKSEEFKGGLPNAIGSLGGVGKLIMMDYDRPAGTVIKDVGDALIPLIAAGLSVIPGVGGIISGVVTGVWGFISAFLGGEKQKSPLEIAVEKIDVELNAIKKELKQLAKIPEEVRVKREARLKAIIQKGITAEFRRNKYICDKYAIISEGYSDDLKNNKTISESLRIEMIAYIQDCDNFLKDTAEAFIYDEFADTLWIPSVIATILRVSFLTEVTNYGYSLKIDKGILKLFWSELKADIQKHFIFASKGVGVRRASINESMMESEYEGCRLQRQLIFLDREIYPYGVPKSFLIFGNKSKVSLPDFIKTINDETNHVMIYYNEARKLYTHSEALFNCVYGPDTIVRNPKQELSFLITYIPNKIYQLRVVYYIAENNFKLPNPYNSSMTLVATAENNNDVKISITPGKPNNNSKQRFLFQTGFHTMYSTAWANPGNAALEKFKMHPNEAVNGTFVIENVVAFQMKKSDTLSGKITIQCRDIDDVFIFGAELIILPMEN